MRRRRVCADKARCNGFTTTEVGLTDHAHDAISDFNGREFKWPIADPAGRSDRRFRPHVRRDPVLAGCDGDIDTSGGEGSDPVCSPMNGAAVWVLERDRDVSGCIAASACLRQQGVAGGTRLNGLLLPVGHCWIDLCVGGTAVTGQTVRGGGCQNGDACEVRLVARHMQFWGRAGTTSNETHRFRCSNTAQ